MTAQHKPAEHGRGEVPPMTAQRARFFIERFGREEKLLGPSEKLAVEFTIAELIKAENRAQDDRLKDLTINQISKRLEHCEAALAKRDEAIAALTQPKGDVHALIAAAQKHASRYKDDDRECITTDVLNAFYAGSKYQQGVSLPRQSEAEPRAWAMTDYQSDGPNTQFTTDRQAAEHYASEGLHVEPLYTTPPAQVDTTAGDGMDWRALWAIERVMRLMDCGLSKDAATKAMQQEEKGMIQAASAQDGRG